MRLRWLLTGVGLLMLWGTPAAFAAYQHLGDMDSPNFTAVYPDKAGTKLDSCALCHTGGQYERRPGVWSSMGSCQWCHYTYGYDQSGDITETLNPYGRDYLANGRSAAALTAVETLDSDGDGYANRTEIDAIRYPGNSEDDPSRQMAPYRVYTREELEALPAHRQFLLMNTSKSGDFYAEYTGVAMETLLYDAGLLSSATGVTVFAPDGWSQYHPLQADPEPEMYHVMGTYPDAPFYYDIQADTALSPDIGWCDYSAPSNAGRRNGDAIENPDRLRAMVAYLREGENLTSGELTADNKLDGEGPYRIVVPQKNVNPPDQASNSDQQDVIWPYNEDWDHNAGACTRSVTMIRVDPLPPGTTDIDILEAGWDYVDDGKILVYGAVGGLGDPADRLDFQEAQTIDSHEARSWESFEIDGETYLAVANQSAASAIYKWDGASFVEIQTIDALWAECFESFVINGDTYLALALNRRDNTTRLADSPIYKWNGSSFEAFQTIATWGARDWESFVIGGDTYLAVANERNDDTRNVDSVIYKWDGTGFVPFQSIPTNSARDWESFVIDGDMYLAMANQDNDATRDILSRIYKWNGAEFVEFQAILTASARDWESFTVDGVPYLAIANNQSPDSRVTASKIYRWNGTGFDEFQSFLTYGAHDWESFVVDGVTYLTVANNKNDETPTVGSAIYKWNGTAFSEIQTLTTYGIRDWEAFQINGQQYLVAANDDDEYDENILSAVYRLGDAPRTEDDGGGSSDCFIESLFH